MFVLSGLALSAITSLFSAIMPILMASLVSLLGFAIPRAAQLPKYIRLLFLLYQDSKPDSQTRKYTTGALLILGSLLTFMAHSFIPFTGIPVIGAVTTPIAVLVASVILLATLDLVTKLNEPYLADLQTIYTDDFRDMQDDLLTLKVMPGLSWNEITKKLQKIFDDLERRMAELGKEISKEINKYFSNQLDDLLLYLDQKKSSRIILTKSDIEIITESLEPWKKVSSSLFLGAGAGTGAGMAASSIAASTLAPATWWTPFVPGGIQAMLVGGRTVVSGATFGICTVAAPIALGVTIGAGLFSATMFTLGKIEENKLSEFLADIVIASLPMVRADGNFSEEEKLSIQQLIANPKICDKDKNRINTALNSNASFDEIITQNILHDEKEEKSLIRRRLILTFAWEIAKADGKIDDQEMLLHNRMAKILQVSQETVEEIRHLITPKLFLTHCHA